MAVRSGRLLDASGHARISREAEAPTPAALLEEAAVAPSYLPYPGSRGRDSGLAILGRVPLARAVLLTPDHGLLAPTRSPAPESRTRQGSFNGRRRPVAEERPVFLRRSADVSVEGRSNRGRGPEPGQAAKALDWLGGRLQYLARSIDACIGEPSHRRHSGLLTEPTGECSS